ATKPLNSVISKPRNTNPNNKVTVSHIIICFTFLLARPFSATIKVPLLDNRNTDDKTTVVTLNISEGRGPSDEGVKIKYVANNVRNIILSTPKLINKPICCSRNRLCSSVFIFDLPLSRRNHYVDLLMPE